MNLSPGARRNCSMSHQPVTLCLQPSKKLGSFGSAFALI
jgi:hypothetical protein